MNTVEVTRSGVQLTVALNRPEQHNAMTPEMIGELTAIFRDIPAAAGVRLVILTGRGRSFCAGADLAFMRAAADYTFAENVADGEAIFDLMSAVDECSVPVIGRVNGAAIGGGCGLVACCDSVVAIERAQFAFSETRLGIVPAVISPFVLAKTGAGPARELFLTGERFSAARARRIGLVHHIAEDETALDQIINERTAEFLQSAPGAQAAAKTLVRELAGGDRQALRQKTAELIANRRASDEGREGMSAFLEKRPPSWRKEG